ncbi:MAG: hypothetical protein ACR2QO_16225 [Acidimicrobiales bacterium]
MSRSVLTPPDPSSGDAMRSTVEERSRRRTIGQGIAVLALGAGVWLVVTGGGTSVIGGELGSDDGLSTERVALARILDGVVARVEVEAIDASGDQGAEFGAGAGPSGRPPAAPSLIGRDDPMPGGTGFRSGPLAPSAPSADDGEVVPPGTRSSTTDQPATTRPPMSTATTRSPTVMTAAVTTSRTTPPTPTPTAPSTMTTGAITTGAVTTGAVTTGAVTTASTTSTTAASTTQPESTCVVTVSKITKYRADHKGSSPVIGEATPGTYDVLERHGAKWYRVAGGWLRDNKRVTPSSC